MFPLTPSASPLYLTLLRDVPVRAGYYCCMFQKHRVTCTVIFPPAVIFLANTVHQDQEFLVINAVK